MSTLALIAAEYREAAEALSNLDIDAQTVADTLESISGDLETKSLSVAHVARSIDAEAEAIEAWAKQAAERAKAMRNRANGLRDYLAQCLASAGLEKVSGPGLVLSWRKSSAVVIDDESQIPLSLMVCPPAPAPRPDKIAIAAELKAGHDVPGARMEHRRNLQVK